MNYQEYNIIYIYAYENIFGFSPKSAIFSDFPSTKTIQRAWGIPNPLGLQAAKKSPSRSSTEVSTWPFLASWGHVELGETRIPSGKGGILIKMDAL